MEPIERIELSSPLYKGGVLPLERNRLASSKYNTLLIGVKGSQFLILGLGGQVPTITAGTMISPQLTVVLQKDGGIRIFLRGVSPFIRISEALFHKLSWRKISAPFLKILLRKL